jgi:hypothetical protein
MDTSFTIKYIDHLPKVPQELIGDFSRFQQNRLIVSTDKKRPGELNREVIDHESRIDLYQYYGFEITGPLLDWVRANILATPVVTNALYIGPTQDSLDTDKSRYPHVDITRKWPLMYIIDTGGSNVRTKFFKHRDRPLYIPGDQSENYRMEDLTEIDDVCIEPNRWCILNGRIIHQVVNIEQPFRTSIQLSMQENYFADYCK